MKKYRRKWVLANRDKVRAAARKRYQSNPDKPRESARRYRLNASAEAKVAKKVYDHNWRLAHPIEVKMSHHKNNLTSKIKRHAIMQTSFVEPVSIKKIYIRDKGMCGICKKKLSMAQVTIDHILPLSKGGTHEPKNVRVAHFSCNSRRGNRGEAQLRLLA